MKRFKIVKVYFLALAFITASASMDTPQELIIHDVYPNICQHMDKDTRKTFGSVSKTAYKSTLSLHWDTQAIMNENRENMYMDWADIPAFSPQRTYWTNHMFMELLSLTLNIKAGRDSFFDNSDSRQSYLCNKIINSALPKNCLIVRYVNYLTSFFKTPTDFSSLIGFEGYNNEKSLYLFHTYFINNLLIKRHLILTGLRKILFIITLQAVWLISFACKHISIP